MARVMPAELVGVVVENLRGYAAMEFPLDRPTTVVVGRNNAGKTSVLRLLHWLLNETSPESFKPAWELPSGLSQFLLPARHARHKARRLQLRIAIKEPRSHSRFGCVDGVAVLRMNLRLTPTCQAYLSLGGARRGEPTHSDIQAVELLRRVQQAVRLIYVPSFRDAGSARFRATLDRSLNARVAKRAVHAAAGGAPAEYRSIKKALDHLGKTVRKLANPLWPEVRSHLPPGLVKDGRFDLDCEVDDLVRWLTSRLSWKVATGVHDEAAVPIADLGSGLQSLLDLAVQQSDLEGNHSQLIMVVEEPESFLHPSAQRVITRALLREHSASRLVVTTHSAVVVDEARYGEVAICRDQRFYYPRVREASERDDINSALLSGQGAEMLFARSVLLVEGPGDRLFFEKLRRRLARADLSGRVDELFVVEVGGKSSFGPWARLLESYGQPSDRPIQWLIAADGDAGADIRRALQDAKYAVPRDVLDALGEAGAARDTGIAPWVFAIRKVNHITRAHGTPFLLMPVDLEHQAMSACSDSTWQRVATKAGITASSLEDLLGSLGSKASEGSGRYKSPWIRGYLGASIPADEVSEDTKEVLQRWMEPILSNAEARTLINNLGAELI